ncbi:hypothetical protein BTS2_3330 [Bacillus sp. TS-2]|nr:hypothetical protein BTS2_3330 [Bacillus sp. TS-2]
MGYNVSLYKVPEEFRNQEIHEAMLEDMLSSLSYDDDTDKYLLLHTNFSSGNPNALDFEEIFDIEVTMDDFYKIYKMEDFIKTKNKTIKIDDSELMERINKFLKVIELELNKGEIIFFSCD